MRYNPIQLIKRLKELKPYRKCYKIKPTIKFGFDDRYYCMSLIPTIIWYPWIFRDPKGSFIEIWWLNFHICIGEWIPIENKKGD